jgi:short-subunit dehydrogenase
MTRPIALITGASAGLGREFAIQLARDGYDLVLVARDEGRLSDLGVELNQRFGATSEVLPADLTIDSDVSRVVERIDRAPIDLLVNNAGFGTKGLLARTSREGQEAMLRVHVLAAHRLAQAAVQAMVPRGSGAIINVSSVASFVVSLGNVNYNATKAWQRIFIEALALELRGTGVYVQALCPGFTHTEFHARVKVDKTTVPSWMWMNADRVVAESLEAVAKRGPIVVVPGMGYKLIVFATMYLPRWLQRRILGRRRLAR